MHSMEALAKAVKDLQQTRLLYVERAKNHGDLIATTVGQAKDLVEGYAVQTDQNSFVLTWNRKSTKIWTYDDAVKFSNDLQSGLIDKIVKLHNKFAEIDLESMKSFGEKPAEPKVITKPIVNPVIEPVTVAPGYICTKCQKQYPPDRPQKDCPNCGGANTVVLETTKEKIGLARR